MTPLLSKLMCQNLFSYSYHSPPEADQPWAEHLHFS